MQAPAVQQGVATGNPDVDAIFRLTRSSQSLDIKFDNSAPPVILPKGTYAPYNSQNTLFTWRSFWSLMLPISVSARVTDIYRAYWAQALMTMLGDSVGHYSPTALQIRNPHNLAKDMKDEALIYDTIYEYANFLRQWQCNEVCNATYNLTIFHGFKDVFLKYRGLAKVSFNACMKLYFMYSRQEFSKILKYISLAFTFT